jgi:hypothetical protein
MKILFLDVDGVLNRCGLSGQGLEEDKLDLLKHITEATGCEIVVSSTWRMFGHRMDQLRRALYWRGIPDPIGTTPVHPRTSGTLYIADTRGKEIKAWMRDSEEQPEVFVILDDDADMGGLLSHLVKTESFTGLTPEIAQEVIQRLNSQIIPKLS